MTNDEKPHYAAMIDGSSIEELKLALLRAIDHARKSSAEVAAIRAELDDANDIISALRRENQELGDRLKQLTQKSK